MSTDAESLMNFHICISSIELVQIRGIKGLFFYLMMKKVS